MYPVCLVFPARKSNVLLFAGKSVSPSMYAASDCTQHLWMKGRVCSTLFKKCPDNTKTNTKAITILDAGIHLGLFVREDVVCCLVYKNYISLHFILINNQIYTTRLFTEL